VTGRASGHKNSAPVTLTECIVEQDGEGKSRRKTANPGSPARTAIKLACMHIQINHEKNNSRCIASERILWLSWCTCKNTH